MSIFRYRAYGPAGEFAEGNIEAISQDAATDALWAQGLVAFQIGSTDPGTVPWWRRELFVGGGSRGRDLAAFTREFATLTAAEIPLDDALRIVSDQQLSSGLRHIVKELLTDVLNGSTLSDAMQKHPRVFPADYLSVVRAGELGGTLGQVFEELADLLDRRMELRARLQSSLIYPAMLIVLSLGSVGLVIGGLIPSIAPIFAESGKPLPSGIKFLVSIQSMWLEILSLLIALTLTSIFGALTALRRPPIRLKFDAFKLRLPIVGTLILQQETARFARTLGTLLKAGVPLVQAAGSAQSVIGNRHIASGCSRSIEAIREGATLHHALGSETVLPPLALRMISIGEEVGKLGQMLMRVAVTFEQQTQRTIDRFMTLLVPFLTIVIAGLIGGLIMTVINAILSINNLVLQ